MPPRGPTWKLGHETHLSTEQNRAQAPAWLSCAHGNQGRTQGSGTPPRAWPQEAVGLTERFGPSGTSPGLVMERLKSRPDFLRASKGIRRISPSVTVELCPTPASMAKPGTVRIGFTATRKIGGAVERNRAKRRLRAAAAALLPLYGREGNDYVLVARQDTLTRPFDGLLEDLVQALHAAHSKLGRLTTEEPR